MKTRTLLIALGVLVVAGVLCLGAAAGSALAYFSLRSRPAQALGPVRWVEPRQLVSEAGFLVARVDEGSPAAEAGIERGDIILEVNDEPVSGPLDMTLALEGLEAGDQLELVVQHGDEQRTLAVTLDERDGRPYLGLTPAGFPLGRSFPSRAFAEGL
jgi:S1-C subfamily serine protease